MKILVLGLRGFPDVMGGVETHCQNLYPLLSELGCRIEVIARSPYIAHREWRGIRFHRLWSPKAKSWETIIHTFLGVCLAAVQRPDVLHIHAIGPALFSPVARLLGLRVVVTHHGEDYQRQKWGGFARFILELGERWGMNYSHERIVISEVLKNLVWDKYQRTSRLIPNGVTLPDIPKTAQALQEFGLERDRYVLLVSRLVPEKRHLDLIRAFSRASLPGWKLVLVGGSDHPDEYMRAVLEEASSTPNVVCTGFQTGTALQELYAHAGLFVLPSSHEGHPIALLEAMSYGLPVLVSDIPAHTTLELPKERYFPMGNIEALSERLSTMKAAATKESNRETIRNWVHSRYDWAQIAQETLAVYESVMRDPAQAGH